MGNSELFNVIVHYQQCLEKYSRRNNESRMLYCISKLYKMPITVEHLEQTGVGRTVNALRKVNGEVGDAAKSLVAKWKEMVVGNDSDTKEYKQKESEHTKSHRHESKDKHISSSSHKESDTRNKHENQEKTTNSSSYSEEESQPSKRKEELKYGKHEKSDKKEKESRSHRHKSSKQKHDSDNSEEEDNEYDEELVNDYKHKSSKYNSEDSIDEEESYYKSKKNKRSSHKEKSSKRKYEETESESDEVNVKRKRSSESEDSEEEIEEVEIKRHSSKQHSKYKEESSESREKSKHESRHKHKKDKRDHHADEKAKKEADKSRKEKSDHKSKDKHSSKEKSKSNSEKKSKSDKSSDKKSQQSSSKHDGKDYKSKKSSHGSSSAGTSMCEDGIGSGSGASFAEALGMLMPSNSKTSKKKVAVIHPFPVEKSKASSSSPEDTKSEPLNLLKEKKLDPLDINVSNLLPEITPNYRPLGVSVDNGHSKNKITAEDEALSAIMYSKISRTKVYSGNKVAWAEVPTLFDLCTHVLQDNLDALEYTGGVPYSILKPVIERANPDQLYMLEHHNPYLIEDTDELWQLHCQKEFRNKRREEMETWRDMYMRCLDEREAKLKALTANIKQSQDKSLPVRQTKLAYVDSVVKPPRSIARKQAKHGTGGGIDKKPLVTPSSRLATLATAGAAGQIAVPNPAPRASSTSGSSSSLVKPKKAPLMQKTLAFMKNRCFRR